MIDLIVGGTSGLGLEIAREAHSRQNGNPNLKSLRPVVTGRHDPNVEFANYWELDLDQADLPKKIGTFMTRLEDVKTLYIVAGFFQEGRITDLSEKQIEAMLNVGGRALIYFTKSVLEKQGTLDRLVTVTSTSQWVPRQYEPVYNFVKAGAAHYSRAMAEDGRVGKVLVAGPAGMATDFWEGTGRDTSKDLDPAWVARQVLDAQEGDFKYKEIRILRDEPRVELAEER